MKNFIQTGDMISVPAPATVSSGDIVVVGGLIGVAATDAASGAPVEIKLSGAFTLPKVSAQAWATVGLPIYWDGTAATTVATDNTFIGVNIAVAGNPTPTGVVRLGAMGVPSGAQITAEIAAAP